MVSIPHPLPGQFQQGGNDLVLPPYPEIGWNDVPAHHQPHVHDEDFFQPEEANGNCNGPDMQVDDPDQEDAVEQQVDNSAIVNLSSDSEGSVNGGNGNANVIANYMRFQSEIVSQDFFDFISLPFNGTCIDIIPGMGCFGPVLPPDMLLERILRNACHLLFTEDLDGLALSNTTYRRSTRNVTKLGGYKFEILSDKAAPRRKAQSAKPDDEQEKVAPFTPIAVLQRVGQELEIPAEDISLEKLMADPDESKAKKKSKDV